MDTWCFFAPDPASSTDKYCTGTAGCCQASFTSLSGASSLPNEVQAKWLYSGNHATDQDRLAASAVNVFVAEEGWVDQNNQVVINNDLDEVPIVLEWSVTGLPPAGNNYTDVTHIISCFEY